MNTTPKSHVDVITVVRDTKNHLGKAYQADGSKSAHVSPALLVAKQLQVPDAAAMAKLLKEVGDNPNAALINAGFPDIPVDTEFLILSETTLRTKLRWTKNERPSGVHQVSHNGKRCSAVGRFKENTCPSSWQLLDRDCDRHTPREFSSLDHAGWLNLLERVLPGLGKAAKVTVLSSSARVSHKGRPVASGNQHTWIQLADPNDVERMRGVIKARCIEHRMHWTKPRHSRQNPDEVVGYGAGLPIDESVWVPGRLVFCGKPTVPPKQSFSVRAISPVISNGIRLESHAIPAPSIATLNKLSANAPGGFQWTSGKNGCLTIRAHDLTLKTEIELEKGPTLTVEEALLIST